MCLKVFRVKSDRLRQTLRFLPFLSLITDFILKRFSIGNWLNPLSCDSCVQKFILQVFFPGLKSVLSEKQISLINYFKIEGFDPIFSSIFIGFCLVTAFYLLRKIYHVFFIYRSMRVIEKEGTSYQGKIKNPILEEALIKSRIQLIAHEEIVMPMTAYKPIIYIPAHLDQMLSQEEFEAVIAHELEHIRNKDVFFKTCCQFIATLAWWIPTESWLQRLDHDIELASDQGAAKYKACHHSLASAMVKLAKENRNQSLDEMCYLAKQSNPVLERVQTLLGLSSKPTKSLLWGGLIGVVVSAIVLSICAMWL